MKHVRSCPPEKIIRRDALLRCARGLLVYCADYRCSYYIAVTADQWADDVRISDIEARFVCTACGRRGANFHWEEEARRRLRDDTSGKVDQLA
jgi:hypothetical protein